ncbi:MAG TPA: xanthine dehydrogenase family protein molybdopterin-binding subunit [Chloroflexota bacterium]|nr:xanthine dehydrogenase family protein molybdopterin-binding subunit [Chloroflexota bacterium]
MFHVTPEIDEVLREPEYRIEGPLKVSGRAQYTGDLQLPGTLWAKFATSAYPHARILHVETEAAKKVPGVHAVITGRDVGPRRFGRFLYDWPVLAYDRVLYIGERIAAVAAETREAAEEAVRLIHVEYEELPAVFDPEEALRDGAPILHPNPEGYYYLGGERPPRPHPNLQGYLEAHKGEGEIERVFERADRIFEDVYVGPRQHQGYIEPHACVVWVERDGTVHVRSTNKAPFSLRHQLSIATGTPEERIVVDSMFIGGDFGGKGHTIEEFPCFFLAQATGRPIKSVMTYADELTNTSPRHDARIYLRTGVTRDGRLLAHQQRAYFNGGAYGGAKPMPGPNIAAAFDPLDTYSVAHTDLKTFTVYTNTTPSGHMRAPGATIADLAGEEHIDHIAREMGIDPLEFRVMNVIRSGDISTAGHPVHHSRGEELLELLRRETGWGKVPLPPNRGRGVVIRHHGIGQGKTEILLRLIPGGKVEALYGTPDQGSGSATVVRRVAAAVLNVEPERVVVRYGNTAEAPPDAGAGSSRVTHIVGQATIGSATLLKSKLEELAAEVMGWPAGQVRIEGGRFVADGGESAPFESVAEQILRGGAVEAKGEFDSAVNREDRPDGVSFYGYVIEVEVDPATGAVQPIEAVLAIDPGTVINPIAYQGQLDGGFVYGFGNAMMEELLVDGGRIVAGSLADYKLPTQMDIPRLRTVLLPPEAGPGPFGAKSVGETNNSAVAAAIANAVRDAVGVRIRELPITPERVYRALEDARGNSASAPSPGRA